MECTPKRLRRVSSDAPTGLKDELTRSRRAERKRSQESLDALPEEKLEKGQSTSSVAAASASAAAPEEPYTPLRHAPPPHLSSPSTSAAASSAAAAAACLELPAPAPAAGPAGTDVARLLVLSDGGDDGTIEFELDGKVYRVKDPSAFKEVVAKAPQEKKQPRRTLSDIRRAQRLARASEASTEAAAARDPFEGAASDLRAARPASFASSSGPADAKLLLAWRLAKEEPLLEEPMDFEADL